MSPVPWLRQVFPAAAGSLSSDVGPQSLILRAALMVSLIANAALPHGSGTDRVLGKDEFVLIDAGGSLHGYASDVTRVRSFTQARDSVCSVTDKIRIVELISTILFCSSPLRGLLWITACCNSLLDSV